MEQEFTVLENKRVGRNMCIARKVKDVKAADVATHLGLSESAYTKYERGESQITVEIIQKVAEFHKLDPLQLLMSQPGHVVENVHNSPFAIHGSVATTDEKQTALVLKLIETQVAMNEKIMALLEKK